MSQYKVEFTVTIRAPGPISPSIDHVEEWVRFNLRENGVIQTSNPLCDVEMCADDFSVEVNPA